MTKFDITQWSDFVRGLVAEDTAESMREALSEGNSKDRRTVELLREVAEVGVFDAKLEIPEHALRGAKAIGSLRRPQAEEERGILRYLPFRLTFDSLLQPAAVGTRNLHAQDRQLIYESEGYTVEVRLEREADTATTALVGELLAQGESPRPATRIPVLIKAGDRIVAQATTGRFGEFQAEGLPAESLSLALMVGETECIQLPLHAM